MKNKVGESQNKSDTSWHPCSRPQCRSCQKKLAIGGQSPMNPAWKRSDRSKNTFAFHKKTYVTVLATSHVSIAIIMWDNFISANKQERVKGCVDVTAWRHCASASMTNIMNLNMLQEQKHKKDCFIDRINFQPSSHRDSIMATVFFWFLFLLLPSLITKASFSSG